MSTPSPSASQGFRDEPVASVEPDPDDVVSTFLMRGRVYHALGT
ncbi:hypothetical protein [Archangium violaceum]|nr:hypothetical protein [Archangium violaceum]